MSVVFEGFKPSRLWKHFGRVLETPHCSGNEKALGDYIISVAKSSGLIWKRDSAGNIVVRKPASPGRENAGGVILQAHIDMVGEKNSDVVHDFAKEAIKPQVKGDWVQATGTTLGSDNGIGLAATLAVLEDPELVHGPLECLYTVDEETGLTGANALKTGFLKGMKMLNLDSEEEGTFTIGCAGGGDSEISLSIVRKGTRLKDAFRLKVFGLRGGHSGLDINQGRGNAIKFIARLLQAAQNDKEFKFEIIRLEGGNKRNAIPREAWADVYIHPSQEKRWRAFLLQEFDKIRDEYKVVEDNARMSLEKTDKEKEKPLAAACRKLLIDFLLSLPHGVLAMHPEIPGLVETSTNLGVVRTGKKGVQITCNSRSSVASALVAARNMIKAVAGLASAKLVQPPAYPGWKPNLQSGLLKKAKDVHQQVVGKEAHIVAVHAGLECGIIGEKFPGMDMISFGPTIEHPHSPEERVHIGSVEKFWNFLTAFLRELS